MACDAKDRRDNDEVGAVRQCDTGQKNDTVAGKWSGRDGGTSGGINETKDSEKDNSRNSQKTDRGGGERSIRNTNDTREHGNMNGEWKKGDTVTNDTAASRPSDTESDQAIEVRFRESVGVGTHALIELAPCGTRVTKCVRPDETDPFMRKMELRFLIRELDVYRHLDPHPRILKFYGFTADPETAFITLEYMKNGNLRDYLDKQPNQTMRQRMLWCAQAAEGLYYLHGEKVVHSDVRTENMLVADDLTLRIIDFGGSAIKGDRPLVAEATRYFLPRSDWTTSPDTDRFALGSCFYHIWTGHEPYHDVERELVDAKFAVKEYPHDVYTLLIGEIILKCWDCKYKTTREVYMDLYNLRDKV
ncbi:Protein kinase-like domain protein [Niveomyces insectorum RCEF 264]|uniref:EKC/KEOPS complex subunit BUD32 n=1 Tax=Niveomyces insectorum RCEF 264 TaxID=1081102 RepID=A0A168AD04_9HYPO|nr:Protein kinase-like domain protein [Niveomyces insectorum RCEF 264]